MSEMCHCPLFPGSFDIERKIHLLEKKSTGNFRDWKRTVWDFVKDDGGKPLNSGSLTVY